MLDSRARGASFAKSLIDRTDTMRLYSTLAAILLLAASALPSTAHEFWISPDAYQVESGAPIVAAIRVGQDFDGPSYAFIPRNIRRFDLVQGDTVIEATGRIGDRPALTQEVPQDGLWTVVHATADTALKYKDWETFLSFLDHKDADWAAERHIERGLSKDNVRETYSRYGKSLIGVGMPEGADRRVGMIVEIVAGANPYASEISEMPVQVFYDGNVRADEQVEVFDRAPDGTVSITRYRTDDEGRLNVPVEAGHEYLVDSVVMRELDPAGEDDAAWETLWASLTFRMPE